MGFRIDARGAFVPKPVVMEPEGSRDNWAWGRTQGDRRTGGL